MAIASMPMYEMPEVRKALDSLWAGLARNFRREGIADVPDSIVHDRPLAELWADPELCFSQCCGYDLVNRYAGKLQPIVTPHYGAPECEGRDYASVVIVAEACEATDVLEMRGAVCVINGPESHSGMSALRALIAPVSHAGRFFSRVEVSGTHAGSLAMIRSGDADVAAVDCVTYALLRRNRPDSLIGTRKLGRTYRAPGIPYVTRSDRDEDTIARTRTAIFKSFADPNLAGARDTLLLKDIEQTTASDYQPIMAYQDLAARYGYPELR